MRWFACLIVTCLCWISTRAQSVNFTSSNLPIIVVKTNGGTIVDDPKIVVDMGIIDNGPGNRNNLTDPFNAYNGKAAIEIRGSSSQMFPKKQYGIELRAENGLDDNELALFGMPKEGDWILFAPYNDKTLIRDALSYRLGRSMGNYASRSRYFELVLNDQYMGVYVFFEKVKRGKNRVNIEKLEEGEISGNDLTGGYILKLDKTTGGDQGGFTSSHTPEDAKQGQKIYFQYEYPKGEDIVAEQKTYIQNYVKQFEDALASEQYNDPNTGWTKYADMNSFVDYFIMNELTKNPDAYRLSTFMYKKRDSDGGKLFMGPVWDFNLGFGNVNYCTQGTPTGLVIDFNFICPDDYWQIPFWWRKLWSDPAFRLAVTNRWETLRENKFSNATVLGYVDSVATVLTESQQRNFQKWPVLGVYVWPNYKFDINTYSGEVAWMKTWIEDRMAYLDGVFGTSITGVNERVESVVTVSVSPNPFDREVLFDYDVPVPGVTRIEIGDILGRIVTEVSINHEAGRHSTQATVSTSPGFYFYRITHNGGKPVTGKLYRK
ncbi:MAG TPA: CotH kinase family protein [Cyclobacteriaceae bacterium]|nr:CotH kinase family protein [Cyclobacteriaceae bacterium]